MAGGQKMKFREHRGSLADSMETVVEIPATKAALKEEINKALWPYRLQFVESQICVDPYGYDSRIQWDTHIVIVEGYGVFGFTDSPVS